MDDRLYRSTTDRSLAGVCGGVAAWLGIDPSLVRIGWVVLALLTGGALLVLYVVMAVVVPEAPPGWAGRAGRPPSPDGPPGGWSTGSAGTAPGGAWTASTGGWTTPDTAGAAPGSPSSWPEDWGRPRPGASPEIGIGIGRSSMVAGIILIALGIWFLVRDYLPPIDWNLVWPVAVIVLGGWLIAGALRRSSR